MRGVLLKRPFVDGVVEDTSASEIGPSNSAFAQDLIAPNDVAEQRHGWVYDGDTADVASNLASVARRKFVLNGNVRTSTTGKTNGNIYSHKSSGAATLIFDGTVEYLSRGFYRDQELFCAQDGISPMRFWSGAEDTAIALAAGPGQYNFTAGSSQFTGSTGTITPAPSRGMYLVPKAADYHFWFPIYYRIVESNTTGNDWVSLEDIFIPTGYAWGGSNGGTVQQTGLAFPCVEIYKAGTVTINSGTGAAGFGTKWSTGPVTILTESDALVVMPDGVDSQAFNIHAVGGDASLSVSGGDATTLANAPYRLQRRLPGKDACGHKDCLWVAGNAFYPNRVYVGPPKWNPAFPPGDVLPFRPVTDFVRENSDVWTIDFIDVPAAFDGDDVIAILPSPDPLLVLKRKALHGIFGEYPNFTRQLIKEGAGCIDLRSAKSTNYGQFWAGENGIFAFTGNDVVDLTKDTINSEWRALTLLFDYGVNDYCTIEETEGHLLVSIMTGGGTIHRCFVYDLIKGCWISNRFTNHKARYMAASNVPGERRKLLWVGDDKQGRVMNSTPCFDGTGLAKDGDGTSPRMQAWTSEGIGATGTIDAEIKVIDAAVSANVYDAGAAGATKLDVSLVSGGSLASQATSTKALGTINSDAVDRVDRKFFHPINKRGRLHQLRVDVSTLGTNTAATKIEIPEITVTVDDMRART